MKKILVLKLANFISLFWRIIPFKIRRFIFTSLFILESRDKKINKGLSRIFYIKDKLEWVINERSIHYDNGIHPKHRLTNYHQFFIDRIKEGDTVLDVGCGIGAVALDIAKARPKCKILGIDINKDNISFANKLKKNNSLENISFIFGNIMTQKGINSDVVILSNVLEHIDQRETFLNGIIFNSKAKNFLIRVPLFERDWQIPLRKELGIYYYSDLDHEIEHSLKEFKKEMNKVNLRIIELNTLWGEIWAQCEYGE